VIDLPFRPKLVDCLREGYGRAQLLQDLGAGVTVGVVALPLAMAFAIASGVAPQAGIFTAIIAGFLISLLGGSRVQIGGPTGAYIVIVYGIVAQHGLANLLICTAAAGGLLFAMGALRVGGLIRFIPVSIVIGFTNGIAVLILLSQVKDVLGLTLTLPDEFFTKVRAIAGHVGETNLAAVALAAACLPLLWFWPKSITTGGQALESQVAHPGATDASVLRRVAGPHGLLRILAKVPGPIAVLALASLAAALLQLPVATIGTRFGGIPQALPEFVVPTISLETLRNLVVPTVTIALLGAIESLLSARVADAMIGDRHDPNQELMAQGIANVVAPFFGGIPATGAIARTATNVRTGGRTPVAGIVHAATLLAIVLAAAPLAQYIPLPALSAVLVVVALNMGDWKAFRELRRYSFAYRVILLSTFVVTVVFDLTLAVELGLVLASLFFIWRVSDLTRVEPLALPGAPPGVAAWKLFGSLFFGSVGRVEPLLDAKSNPARVVILEMHQVISLDTTGLETLQQLARSLARRGGGLVLCGLTPQPASLVARSGFRDELGGASVVDDLDAALARARQLAAPGPDPTP